MIYTELAVATKLFEIIQGPGIQTNAILYWRQQSSLDGGYF